MSLVPKKIFFVKGKGFSINSELRSFEQALRDAGIEKFNIVKVSSIIPPFCEEVSRDEGIKELKTGQVVYSVMSKISSNKKDSIICASIGAARPANSEDYGYLSENHTLDEDPGKIAEITKALAAEMLATTHGVSFDPSLNIKTKSFTESTKIRKDGEWTTVIAAAIFIL